MSKKERAGASTAKFKRPAIERNLSRKKTAKLKLSGWYKEAAQSIGISNKKPPDRYTSGEDRG